MGVWGVVQTLTIHQPFSKGSLHTLIIQPISISETVTMAMNQVGKVSAKAARAVRDGYAASMASVVSVFLLMCEHCNFIVGHSEIRP